MRGMTSRHVIRVALSAAAAALVLGPALHARQDPWARVSDEAIKTLQTYVRIDTSNPPGDTRRTADLLQGILEREGVPVTRYESAPGKAIVVARLKGSGAGRPILLLHHMDVVPADRSRWPRDPFGGDLVDGEIWGRGTMDMKGLGVVHLLAFLELKRQNVPLSRDIILMAVPDEEIGGELGGAGLVGLVLAGAAVEGVV